MIETSGALLKGAPLVLYTYSFIGTLNVLSVSSILIWKVSSSKSGDAFSSINRMCVWNKVII